MSGKIQNADIKSEAELIAGGADKTFLPRTTKFYSPKTGEILEVIIRKNNYSAIVNPTASDDSTQNYEVGSRWVNTATGRTWTLLDSTTSAAVWKEGSAMAEANAAQATADAINAAKGQPNGFAGLDASGVVPLSQIPAQFLSLEGNWDASTNTPTLANTNTGVKGYSYNVSVAGTYDFGAGPLVFQAGDWVYNNGTEWLKKDNIDQVTSVNGLLGPVVLTADEIAPTNTRYWSLKDNLTAIIDPVATDDSGSNYTIGSQWYNSNTGTLWFCDDATIGAAVWTQLSGGGSGVGSSSIYAVLNTDNDDILNWTETGTGIFSFDEIAPHNGIASYKFVTSALNDKTERTVDVPLRSRNRMNVLRGTYQCDLAGMTVYVYDVTNATVLATLDLSVKTNVEKFEMLYKPLANTTQVKYILESTIFTGVQTVIFDDLEFDDNPYAISYGNLFTENVVEKLLPSNVQGNSPVTGLSFTGLVVGKRYRVSGQVYISENTVNSGTDVGLRYKNNGVIVGSSYIYSNDAVNGDQVTIKQSVSFTFIAQGSTLDTEIFSSGVAVGIVYGNSSYDSSYLQLSTLEESEHVLTQSRSANLAGAIIPFGNVSTPEGFLYCDGASYLRADYPDLFAAIGTAYGTADVNHFNVPDMRGLVPRGQDDGAGKDPDAATRTANNIGGNTGDNVGSEQGDAYTDHTHTSTHGIGYFAPSGPTYQAKSWGNYSGSSTTTSGGGSVGAGNETRGKNLGVRWYIRHTNSATLLAFPTELLNAGGSGVGSASIYKLLNADDDQITNWLNTGSGVFTFDGIAPHNGSQSYKWITGALSDLLKIPVDVPLRSRAKENVVSMTYELDQAGVDIIIYDVTNTQELKRFVLPETTKLENLVVNYIVPANTTQIEFRLESQTFTVPQTILFDDIEFNDDAFTKANLPIIESAAKAGGPIVNSVILGALDTSTLSSLVSHNPTTGIYTVLQKSRLNLEAYGYATLVNRAYASILNGAGNSLANNTNDTSNNNTPASASYSRIFEAGETFKFSFTNVDVFQVSVTAEATSSNYITPAKSNMTNMQSYVPVITGFGTATNVNFEYKQIGDLYIISGRFTSGIPTAVEAQISLPNSKLIKSSQLLKSVGTFFRGGVTTNSSNGGSVLSTGSDSFINLGSIDTFTNLTVDPLAPVNANTVANSGDIIAINAVVTIEGLSSDATFLGALPEALFSDTHQASIYKVLDADNDTLGSWNITGALLTFDTVNPHKGVVSYSAAFSAQNDIIKRVIDVPRRSRARENILKMTYEMDVLGGEVIIYDVTNITELKRFALSVTNDVQKLEIPYTPLQNTSQIEYRVENTHATNTPVVKFDSMEFNDDPFSKANLLNVKRLVAAGNAGEVVGTTVDIPFISSVDEAGSWNGSQYTVPFDADISITGNIIGTATALNVDLYVDGVVSKAIGESVSNSVHNFSITKHFTKGQVLSFRPATTITLVNDVKWHHLEITAQATVEHILTTAKNTTEDAITVLGSGLSVSSHTIDNISSLGTLSQSGVYTFTASKKVNMVISASMVTTTPNFTQVRILKNGTVLSYSSTPNTATTNTSASANLTLAAGDVITVTPTSGTATSGHVTLLVSDSNAILTGALPTSLTKNTAPPSIYEVLTADNDNLNNWTVTGGTLSFPSTNPHRQALSYEWVASAQNDLIKRAIPVPLRSRSKENLFKMTYEVDLDGMEAIIYDVTNTKELERFALPVTTKVEDLELMYFVSNNTSSIEIRIENTHVSNLPTIKFDDLVFDDHAFTSKNLTTYESYHARGHAGYGSTNIKVPYFTNISKDETGSLVLIDNSTTLGMSITALQECTIVITRWLTTGTSTFSGISLNSPSGSTNVSALPDSEILGIEYQLTGQTPSFSATYKMSVGDVIRPHDDGIVPNANKSVILITAQAESSHVITPVKSHEQYDRYYTHAGYSSVNTSIPYYITNADSQGSGLYTLTNSASNGLSATMTKKAFVVVTMNQGGQNANGTGYAGISLNSNQLTTSIISINSLHRLVCNTYSSTFNNGSYSVSWSGFVNAGDVLRPHGNSASVPDNTNLSSFSITAHDLDAQILSAIPKRRIATVWANATEKDHKFANSTTADSTLTYDHVTGDNIVALNANQLTFSKGRYLIKPEFGVYNVTDFASIKLYSITDTNIAQDKGNVIWSSTTGYISMPAHSFDITFTKSTTIEVRVSSLTGVINGFRWKDIKIEKLD